MAQTNELFRALADPTRRALFERLARGGEASVQELVAKARVSQPAVSQHLAALRDAGLVEERRDGRFARYRARAGGLRPLVDWLDHYRAFWNEKLPKLKAIVEEME